MKASIVEFPSEWKDANGLHRAVNGETDTFRPKLKELVGNAVPVSQIRDEEDAEERRKHKEERNKDIEIASELLENPGLLYEAINTVQDIGIAGERHNIGLLRLAMRSRALPRLVGVEVNSPSSTGKTHLITTTLALEDPSAYYELTASSERALIYSDENFAHRIIVMHEPDGLPEGAGAAAIKTLVWDGIIRYDTVVTDGGLPRSVRIEKDGPTGLVVSTTRPLDEQISNRMLRTELDTSEEQTEAILGLLGRRAAGEEPNVDEIPWHALSRVLGEPAEVVIAYGAWLAKAVTNKTMRIRRDFTQLISLIKACAVEYTFQRATDSSGRVIATVADYAQVYSLVEELFRAVQGEGVTEADREMVSVLEKLHAKSSKPLTQADLVDATGKSKGTVSYRVARLLENGYIADQAAAKGRGVPKQLVPGAPLPDKAKPLPSPCELSKHLLENEMADLVIPWIDPISGESHNCFEHYELSNTKPETPVTPLGEGSKVGSNPFRTPHDATTVFEEGSVGGSNSGKRIMMQETEESSSVRSVRTEAEDDEDYLDV